jgi:hypothetical protein
MEAVRDAIWKVVHLVLDYQPISAPSMEAVRDAIWKVVHLVLDYQPISASSMEAVRDAMWKVVHLVLDYQPISARSTEAVRDAPTVSLGQILVVEMTNTMDTVQLVSSEYFQMMNEAR